MLSQNERQRQGGEEEQLAREKQNQPSQLSWLDEIDLLGNVQVANHPLCGVCEIRTYLYRQDRLIFLLFPHVREYVDTVVYPVCPPLTSRTYLMVNPD